MKTNNISYGTRKLIFAITVITTLAFTALSITGCKQPTGPDTGNQTAVNIAAILGVTAPVRGATPVAAITDTAQYTGTVAWTPAVSGTFAASTAYTATISLTAKTGFTLQGVTANFFTVEGATSASNSANSGTITAAFPATNYIPVAADYDITGTNVTYDGTAKTVIITPQSDKSEGTVTVFYNGSETAPVNAGTYAVTFNVAAVSASGGLGDWDAVTGLSAGTLTINPKGVTITGLDATDKIYDGTTAATITGTAAINGIINGDDVTLVSGTAAFVNKAAGTGKTVAFSDYSLSGADAGNYALTQPTSVTANISRLQLTIAAPSGSPTKAYDGTTAHNGSGIIPGSLNNAISGDNVNAAIASATYNAATVAGANQITIVYSLTGTDVGNYLAPTNNTAIAATIIRATGAAVNAPTVTSKTVNSITISAASAPANGEQSAEYAVGTASDGTSLIWQEGLIFNGLSAGTTYYAHARSAQSDNYNAGAASVSAAITTLQTVAENVIAYYWVNAQNTLATTDNGALTVAAGQVLTITAQGAGYTSQQWHLNGKNTGATGTAYTFSTTIAGNYILGLFVQKDGKPYNANFVITVTE